MKSCALGPDVPEQMIAWVRQAGQIALRHFSGVVPQIKEDESFLTQVDLEIDRFLSERIRTACPDHGLISEEGTHVQDGLDRSDVWVIDPLDGTTAFVQGLPGWGIAVGLLRGGQPSFGLFYMPLLDDMNYTCADGDVCCGWHGTYGSVRAEWGSKGFLALNASAHDDYEIDVRRTRALGSVGANLVYTARGAASAAFIPKARLWDLVAGAAILTRAGGELRYLSGERVDYAQLFDGRLAPEPILAGHPRLLSELQGRIRPRAPTCMRSKMRRLS